MTISQDTFNKLITSTLLLYCMTMFSMSWYTGKAIDLQGFLMLVAPMLTHAIHLVADNRVAVKSIDAATTTTVAAAATNGHTKE